MITTPAFHNGNQTKNNAYALFNKCISRLLTIIIFTWEGRAADTCEREPCSLSLTAVGRVNPNHVFVCRGSLPAYLSLH